MSCHYIKSCCINYMSNSLIHPTRIRESFSHLDIMFVDELYPNNYLIYPHQIFSIALLVKNSSIQMLEHLNC